MELFVNSQCKVSLCERNTHAVSSLLALKIVVVSQHKRQRNKFLSRFVDNENSDSDLKVLALHYANELFVRVTRTPREGRYYSFTARN